MAVATLGIRERVAGASKQIRRLKRIDRAAVVVITLGGLGIVASVLGIIVFILAEAGPLFRPARGNLVAATPLGAETVPAAPSLILGTDEYQMNIYDVRPDGRIRLYDPVGGKFRQEFTLPSLAGRTVQAASRTLTGDYLGLGTADGRVTMAQLLFRPRYENQALAALDVDVNERGTVALDPTGRPIRELDYAEDDSGQKVVAALVGDDELLLWRSSGEGEERRNTLRVPLGEAFTHVRLGRTDSLVAGTNKGNVYHWELSPEVKLTDISPTGPHPVTALGWILGGATWVAGNSEGELSGWFRARLRDEDTERPMLRTHSYANQGAAVLAVGASSRDKSFVTVGSDGTVTLRHGTSERTLLAFAGDKDKPTNALITPKGDGLLVGRADGQVDRFMVDNPHPEIDWRALLGKVWYEGYARPDYVWQSTGATNDFETKFSLVPLVFGTIKATLYALLFAIPLAVLGALYVSQFVHPTVRSKIKPTVEIMAALPSVVIGFVAGLVLASLVEKYIVAVLLMIPLVPLMGTLGVVVWKAVPTTLARRLRPGMELLVIVPMLLLGIWVSVQIAPTVEAALFDGDFRLWLAGRFGLVYDQRNSLVVGLAMGFAVIPIIFTISDDAFTSVPSSLTAASLALGASRWQTAVRVVLPTASPGVFSAIMIGFGRAVGETMIVLMATGNTPVMDWSIFNGMRTLSANIAVEIPEAPYGGTLYRVLFLAGAMLFTMTFIVNTIAEIVRQRLREKYKAI